MMTTEHTTERNERTGPSRRSVLVLGAAGASTVALAACSKAKSTDNTPRAGSSTTSGAGSSSASTSPSTSPSTSAAGGGPALAKLADIPIGGAISAKDANGSDIIITRPAGTTVAAFTAICTHMGCTVKPGSQTFVCPCHGSTYDAKTGDRISGPARGGLGKINVKVSGQNVVAG